MPYDIRLKGNAGYANLWMPWFFRSKLSLLFKIKLIL